MAWVPALISGVTALAGASSSSRQDKDQRRRQAIIEAHEADRQRRIEATRGVIDTTFDAPARKKQYADYAQALRDYFGEQLSRKKRDTTRGLKFALASSGLTGGSADVHSGARLGDEFTRAAIDNERRTQNAVFGLKSTDEASRLRLHELAMGGMNATTGLRRAGETLGANLQSALGTSRLQGIGDVFTETLATQKAIAERAAARRGYGYTATREDLYGTGD